MQDRAMPHMPRGRTKKVAIMSETYIINGHLYRAYPTRFFRDGIEITPAEFYAAVRTLCGRRAH